MITTLAAGYVFYYLVVMIGISIGYHRYFSHRAFETTPAMEYLMLFCGMLCGGRSPLTWAAVHRMHHATSDTENDPHSPKYVGAWRVITSQWSIKHIPRKYIADLVKNTRLQFFHRYGRYIHFFFALNVVALLGWQAFFIVVVIPFALAYIGFGLLNYMAHRNGEPADVPLMNLLAPGEGCISIITNTQEHIHSTVMILQAGLLRKILTRTKHD